MDRKITKISIEKAQEILDDTCPFCVKNLYIAIRLKRNHVWLWGTDIYLTRREARLAVPKLIAHRSFFPFGD